jgi:hypothetical protein
MLRTLVNALRGIKSKTDPKKEPAVKVRMLPKRGRRHKGR